jgi:hypothetical protein
MTMRGYYYRKFKFHLRIAFLFLFKGVILGQHVK